MADPTRIDIGGNSIKTPIQTDVVSNPMHQFASWTYSYSLWFLDIKDYNEMMDGGDPASSLSASTSRSYVIAQDGGVYPGQRSEVQAKLNYNIQKVEFSTRLSADKTTKSSNLISGKMTIIEPYGVTWLDTLIQLSFNATTGQYENYLMQPYMLQLDFVGYNEAGDAMPISSNPIFRKRFPITITRVNLSVGAKGSEYTVEFKALNQLAHDQEVSVTPVDITVSAATVREFFDKFKNEINSHNQTEGLKLQRQYSNQIDFKFDSAVGDSRIAYEKQMPLGQGDPDAENIALGKNTITIPVNTPILTVIERIIAQSGYLIDQLNLDLQTIQIDQLTASVTQVLNTFKTTTEVMYTGYGPDGTAVDGAFDNIKNNRPTRITYNINQYTVVNNTNPVGPTLTDPRPYIVKSYQYLYTGQNIDVVNLKIDFNTTYYNKVLGYTNEIARTQTTASTGVNDVLSKLPSPMLTPQLIASSLIPGLTQRPNMTPQKFHVVVNNLESTLGFTTDSDPAKQKAINLIKSLYSGPGGDMLKVDLTIVGDPTLIKQDDWLYTPDPSKSSDFNDPNVSLSAYASKYGHLKMDMLQLIVELVINTPLDIDVDWQATGLVFPQPGVYQSLFSGIYVITEIKNKFELGKFEQVLTMARIPNSDWVTSAKPEFNRVLPNRTYVVPPGYDAVTTGQSNQTTTYGR